MELATSTSATAVWGTATRPAAGSLRAVSAPQRPVRQLEAPKPPRRRTQYTLCQATAVARESPAVAASSAVEQQVQQLAELLEACQPELTYQDKASALHSFCCPRCALTLLLYWTSSCPHPPCRRPSSGSYLTFSSSWPAGARSAVLQQARLALHAVLTSVSLRQARAEPLLLAERCCAGRAVRLPVCSGHGPGARLHPPRWAVI